MAKNIYVCPMCKGEKEICINESTPLEPECLEYDSCPLCNGKGYIIDK